MWLRSVLSASVLRDCYSIRDYRLFYRPAITLDLCLLFGFSDYAGVSVGLLDLLFSICDSVLFYRPASCVPRDCQSFVIPYVISVCFIGQPFILNFCFLSGVSIVLIPKAWFIALDDNDCMFLVFDRSQLYVGEHIYMTVCCLFWNFISLHWRVVVGILSYGAGEEVQAEAGG